LCAYRPKPNDFKLYRGVKVNFLMWEEISGDIDVIRSEKCFNIKLSWKLLDQLSVV